MKISFLALLLSVSINTHSGERLEGIAGSMGHSANPLSKLFSEGSLNKDITAKQQEKNLTEALPEITIHKVEKTKNQPTIKPAHKRPTQLFTHGNDISHTTNENNNIQAKNEDCVKEKVYSLDVDNAEKYKRLEDFPFTYECVISR